MYFLFSKSKYIHTVSREALSLVLIFSLVFSPVVVSAQSESDPPAEPAPQEVVVESPPAPEETPATQDEPTDPVVVQEEDVAIGTGDAFAQTDIQNDVNTNIVDTEEEKTDQPDEEEVVADGAGVGMSTSTESFATSTDSIIKTGDDVATSTEEFATNEETATSTPEVLFDAENTSSATSTATTTSQSVSIENENEAVVENNVTVDASTGENTANGNGGDTTIDTGNAGAVANVINVVNTNIFNSTGGLYLFNDFFGFFGDLDLRNLDFPLLTNSHTQDVTCELDTCNNKEDTSVANTNTATIDNNITVTASTGDNTASNGGGGAAINTGDAYAAANVVNVANTNVTDSNYVLLVFNSFGDWNGDFVLPPGDAFSILNSDAENTSSATSTATTTSQSVSIENENEAVVENNVTVDASTGENTANGNGGDTTIDTGNAGAVSNTINQVNTNVFNSDSVFVLFRVYGNWIGDVFGAPKGIYWNKTPNGLELYSNPDGAALSSGVGGADTGGSAGGQKDTNISNNNTANIHNNVQAFALTGNNNVSNGNDASITTGDAQAVANIMNIANTNIVGRNWVLAIVNIFGNWTGNATFGRPDLWIGGRAESEGHIGPGSKVTYHATVKNNGDLRATHVQVRADFDDTYMSVPEAHASSLDGHVVGWDIEYINPGETIELTYDAIVGDNVSYGPVDINTHMSVDSVESDNNEEDNTDTVVITANRLGGADPNPYGLVFSLTDRPVFKLEKTNNASSTVYAGDDVGYTVSIFNGGGPAYNAVLVDSVADEFGVVISEQYWDLGYVSENEEITIDYTITYSPETPTGTYVNHAQVFAWGGNSSLQYGYEVQSEIATSSVYILGDTYGVGGEPEGVSLGEEGDEDAGGAVLAESNFYEEDQETSSDESESNEDKRSGPQHITFASIAPYAPELYAYTSESVHDGGVAVSAQDRAFLLASPFFAFPESVDDLLECSLPALVVIYLVLYLLWSVWLRDKEKDGLPTKISKHTFFIVGTVIAYIIAYMYAFSCVLGPLAIILAILLLSFLAEKYQKNDKIGVV